MQKINKLKHRHITSFQIIILGFLSVILLGSLFLMLPIATKDGQIPPFFFFYNLLFYTANRGYDNYGFDAGFNSVDLTLISEVGQMLIFSAEGFLIILLKMQLLSF